MGKDIKITNKSFGIYTLILSILFLLLLLLSFVFLLLFSLLSDVSVFSLLPFLLFSLALLILPIGGTYIGIRYIRGNVFKSNKNLGLVLIIFGLIMLGYSLIEYVLSNLTGNYGGEFKPIFAFILCTIVVPLGLILRNSNKK